MMQDRRQIARILVAFLLTPTLSLDARAQQTVLKVADGACLNGTMSLEVTKGDAASDYKDWVLFLDGWAFALHPRVDASGNKVDRLTFDLRRDPSGKDAWLRLLVRPDGFTRLVEVSVGPEAGRPIATNVKAYPLIVITPVWFWTFVVLLGFALVLFVWFARESNVLRDPGLEPPNGRRPFSLARTQMAFWFFLVLASYIFIWLVTDDRNSITDSVLGLTGISAATAIGAAVVDKGKAAAAPAPSVLPPRPGSKHFLIDLLSDDDGISLPRFQMFVWTLVLGIIFVASVYNRMAMPEFNGTLLGLLGISSGTYVGFKFRE